MADRSICFEHQLKSSSKFITHISTNRQYRLSFKWVVIVLISFLITGCSTFKQYDIDNDTTDGIEISLSDAQKSLQAFFLNKGIDLWKGHKANGTSEDHEKIVVTQDAIRIVQKKNEETYFNVHHNKYRFKLHNKHVVETIYLFSGIKTVAKFPSSNLNNENSPYIVIYLHLNEARYYSIKTGNQINESEVYTKWARHFDKIPYSKHQEYTIRFPYEDKRKIDYIIKCISVLKNAV